VIPESPATNEPREPRGSSVFLGMLIGIGLQLLAIPLMARSGMVMLIGVTQLFYIVPAILFARSTGRRRLANGIIIAASLVALLNAACWGLVFKLA